MLQAALQKLQSYIESENYRGYDPYDALKSPLFTLPLFKSNKLLRFGFQQLVKRSPVNLRPLLLVPKGCNPVTLGLCIQGYANLAIAYPAKKNEYTVKINSLIDELERLIPLGFSGACWGYDFDWEARYSKIPAYQPTIVATGIITNALFTAFKKTGNKKALELCISAADFILTDIHKTVDKDGTFCFSYSPFDKQVVFNASMKGVRLLAQVYSETKNEKLREEAKKAVAFVMKNQRNDGACIYSKSNAGGWIDNYHTGYVLDCLDEYIHCCNDNTFSKNLERGYQFYRNNFFTKEYIPKFFDKKTFPVDSTAAAQSILTLSRFKDFQLAQNVAEWTIQNMQDEKGYFYYQKHKLYTSKTSFMRWSNAWLFAGLTELMAAKSLN